MAPADWKKFTPAEINSSQCMARTWAGGKGGQCSRPKGEGSDICPMHAQGDKYKVHGRVDGPIPASKLAEFVAFSQKPPPKELTEEEKAARAEKRKAKQADGDEKRSSKKAKKRKKGPKKKDPNAPKKPGGGAFGCFLAANRDAFVKKLPPGAFTAVTKLASTEWKEVSAADKDKYQKQYEAKKAAYDKAMKSYVPPEVEESSEEEEKGEDFLKKAASDEEDEDDEEEEEEEEEEETSKVKARPASAAAKVVKNVVKKKPAENAVKKKPAKK